MEQSVSEKFTSEENPGKRPYLSSVDIMGTYSDNLSQNFLKSDNQIKHELRTNSYDGTFDADSVAKHAKRKLSKRHVNYAKFVTGSHAKTNSADYVLPSNKTDQRNISSDSHHSRYLDAKGEQDNRSRMKRETSNRGQEKKNSCILNFNKLYFGCRSPDTMEFRSDCPLFSSDIISGSVLPRLIIFNGQRSAMFTRDIFLTRVLFVVYLCHGSWSHNVSQNSSIHYLVTTPLSRTSRGVRRYCFMYQTNEDSSLIHFTSTSDTCHRGSIPGLDGALSFNITPIGGAGTVLVVFFGALFYRT